MPKYLIGANAQLTHHIQYAVEADSPEEAKKLATYHHSDPRVTEISDTPPDTWDDFDLDGEAPKEINEEELAKLLESPRDQLNKAFEAFVNSIDETGCTDGLVVADGKLLEALSKAIAAQPL